MRPCRLDHALAEAGILHRAEGVEGLSVRSVSDDTRLVAKGSLFVAMPSASRDTHALLPEAAASGAVAAVVRSAEAAAAARAAGLGAVLVDAEGPEFNFAVGRLCRVVFGDPSLAIKVYGVTGTNGKTTTAWIVRHALEALGLPTAYLGTLGFHMAGEERALENTTPFPVATWRLLDEAAHAGMQAVSMEVSSHALHGRRLAGVSFDAGCFTNLTQDHLDYHGTMEAYESAKKLLFTEYAAASRKGFHGAANWADPATGRWLPELAVPVLTYGPPGAELEIRPVSVEVGSTTVEVPGAGRVTTRLGGRYNVENLGSAIASLIALGAPLEDALRACSAVPPVPGRFESVPNEHGIGVIVDYAHTPDALAALLRCVRELRPSRVVTVFGCGGDRDRTKRPRMAAAASQGSDLTVLTSDNPRTEDPGAIIAEAAQGLEPGSDSRQIPDRREAIAWAVSEARPGDVVVIAGKGHEDYQIIGRTKYPMSDREIAREALEARR